MNYHMHKLQNSLAELMNMLVTAELSMKGSKGSVLAMERTSSKRKSYEKKKKSLQKSKRWKDQRRRRQNRRRRSIAKESVSIATATAIESGTALLTWPP